MWEGVRKQDTDSFSFILIHIVVVVSGVITCIELCERYDLRVDGVG
jgi:hypothetical protein